MAATDAWTDDLNRRVVAPNHPARAAGAARTVRGCGVKGTLQERRLRRVREEEAMKRALLTLPKEAREVGPDSELTVAVSLAIGCRR